jgi:hypothetical protein
MTKAPAFARKIVDREQLARAVALARPLVLTNGVFDILHRGHVTYLAQARRSAPRWSSPSTATFGAPARQGSRSIRPSMPEGRPRLRCLAAGGLSVGGSYRELVTIFDETGSRCPCSRSFGRTSTSRAATTTSRDSLSRHCFLHPMGRPVLALDAESPNAPEAFVAVSAILIVGLPLSDGCNFPDRPTARSRRQLDAVGIRGREPVRSVDRDQARVANRMGDLPGKRWATHHLALALAALATRSLPRDPYSNCPTCVRRLYPACSDRVCPCCSSSSEPCQSITLWSYC